MSDPLNLPITPSSKSSALRWLPFALLAAAAVVLIVKWESIPDRWIIHWGVRGEPDGWASKSPVSVFMPLGFGFLLCAFIEAIAFYVSRIRKPGKGFKASPEAVAAVAAATAGFVRLVNVTMAIVFAFIAVKLPLFPSTSPLPIIVFALGAALIAIVVGFMRMKRAQEEIRRMGKEDEFEGWNGVHYRNPKDARLWVPKLLGMGYTLNFAHPWAWPLFISILSIPLIVVLVIFLSVR